MDTMRLLDCLADLADELGITVRRVPAGAGSGGGVVTLKGRQIVFLDVSAPTADQIAVLASALASKRELEDRYLPPEVRELMDAAADGQV